MLQKQNTH